MVRSVSVFSLKRAEGIVGLCLMLLWLSACSITPNQSAHTSTILLPNHPRVVSDLVAIVDQLLDSRRTTVQYNPADGSNVRTVVQQLEERGYGLQQVSADQGSHFLALDSARDTRGQVFDVRLSIGEVAVGRKYQVDSNDNVQPASAVVIEGSALPVRLRADLFGLSADLNPVVHQVHYRDALQTSLPTMIALQSSQQFSPGSAGLFDQSLNTLSELPSETAINANRMEVQNVFFTNESNFVSTTRHYAVQRREVVVFANDSLILGAAGKQQVREIFNQFNQTTDFLSLLGCSNGYTALAMGNEGLALGRAQRVLEEFELLGVPRSRILDEGCWAPTSVTERYPSRAVIVELRRAA